MSFKIVSDSSCDLPKDYVFNNDVTIVPFSITFDGSTYLKENVDIDIPEFYRRLTSEKGFPKTSLPSVEDYLNAFRPIVAEGLDVLAICLTSKFSASIQSAFNAKNMLLEEFPERRIEIIDSMNVSATQGALVMQMVKMRDKGLSIDQIVTNIDAVKEDMKIYVAFDTLEYLANGGRIGKASAVLGSLLNIKPIIKFENGELGPHSKARGRKKSVAALIDSVENDFKSKNPSEYDFVLLQNLCEDEAKEVTEILNSKGYTVNLPLVTIGVTIGVHSGPKTLGLAYIRKTLI